MINHTSLSWRNRERRLRHPLLSGGPDSHLLCLCNQAHLALVSCCPTTTWLHHQGGLEASGSVRSALCTCSPKDHRVSINKGYRANIEHFWLSSSCCFTNSKSMRICELGFCTLSHPVWFTERIIHGSQERVSGWGLSGRDSRGSSSELRDVTLVITTRPVASSSLSRDLMARAAHRLRPFTGRLSERDAMLSLTTRGRASRSPPPRQAAAAFI